MFMISCSSELASHFNYEDKLDATFATSSAYGKAYRAVLLAHQTKSIKKYYLCGAAAADLPQISPQTNYYHVHQVVTTLF
jgi:hypothetical protein